LVSPETDPSAKPDPLTWDDSFMLARALARDHARADLSALGLETLYRWVLALPEFVDDPALANDEILLSIVRAWYEESDSR
jgi:FeS assembly protein IscX